MYLCNLKKDFMNKLKAIWKAISPVVLNKYLLALIVFAVLIIFFDKHNLIDRIRNQRKIERLEAEIESYENTIQENRQKINELQSSDENLEKFAREQYLMKRTNEDVYLIEE